MKIQENPYPPSFVIKFVRLFGFAFSKIVWRIEFRGVENIPAETFGRGLIVAPNHQTYLDPFWIIIPINRRFRFMAWDRAFTWFGVGKLIRFLGAFPVNIKGGDKEALQRSVEILRDGATLVIFPEGERAFSDGELLEFKTGTVRMALQAKVPILPVTLRGANKVWAQGMRFPRPFKKIEIIFHPPINFAPGAPGKDQREHARRLTEELKAIIRQDL